MKKALAGLVAVVVLLPAASVRSAEHLVTGGDVSAALSAAADGRARDLARVASVLSRPEAVRAVETAGIDAAALRAGLASLNDGELRDLAARAEALRVDPSAGALDPDIRQLLIIFLIVAIVILVLQAVN